MIRIRLFFAVAVVLSGLAFQTYAVGGDLPSSTRVVVDQRGKQVLLPFKVEKIVTFSIPLPLMIWALDGNGSRIAGMHPKSRDALEKDMPGILAPELKKSDASFIKGKTMFNVNIEALLRLSPDVVFQWARMKEDIRMMEAAGIPVIALNPGNYENITGWIRILGEVLDRRGKAAKLIAFHEQAVDMIASRTATLSDEQRPRALFITNLKDGSISVVGKHAFYDFVTGLVGAENCAEDLLGRGGKRVNMEQILIWNPDIIFIGNLSGIQPHDLFENRGWQRVNAVKSRRVHKIPDAGFWWFPPGLESPLYFKWLAQKLHPELFEDVATVKELKNFYQTFYHYSLSDKAALGILEGENQTGRQGKKGR